MSRYTLFLIICVLIVVFYVAVVLLHPHWTWKDRTIFLTMGIAISVVIAWSVLLYVPF